MTMYRALGKNSGGIFAGLKYIPESEDEDGYIVDSYWTQEPEEVTINKIKASLAKQININMIESITIKSFDNNDGGVQVEIICLFDRPREAYVDDMFLSDLISSVYSDEVISGEITKKDLTNSIEIWWQNL